MKQAVGAVAALLATAILTTPAVAGSPPNLASRVQLGVQARSYSVPASAAFNAALSALQDQGYVDLSGNPATGTITGVIDSRGKTILNVLHAGFGKKKWMQKASILVEDQGVGATVRLNLQGAEIKQRSSFGGTWSEAQLIKSPEAYVEFFQQLDAEIARRGGATVHPISFTPDAAGRIDLGGVHLRPANTLSGLCIDAPTGYAGTGAANMPAVTAARPLCS